MRVCGTVFALLLGLLSVVGRADTFTTFQMDGTASDDHTFSGTLLLDNTTGLLVSSDVVLSSVYDSAGNLEHMTQVSDGGLGNFPLYPNPVIESFVLSSADQELFGFISVDAGDATPGHFMGGDICNGLDNCGFYPILQSDFDLPNFDTVVVLHGEVVPVGMATTPEPSSVLLLGSGLLGALAVGARRRFVRGCSL